MEDREFSIITKEEIRNLKQRLRKGSQIDKVRAQLKELLWMKETLFHHERPPGGCAAVFSLSGELLRQVEAIEEALYALETSDIEQAISWLEWYEANCSIPEDEKEAKALIELKIPEGKNRIDRMLEIERLFYQHSYRKILGNQ